MPLVRPDHVQLAHLDGVVQDDELQDAEAGPRAHAYGAGPIPARGSDHLTAGETDLQAGADEGSAKEGAQLQRVDCPAVRLREDAHGAPLRVLPGPPHLPPLLPRGRRDPRGPAAECLPPRRGDGVHAAGGHALRCLQRGVLRLRCHERQPRLHPEPALVAGGGDDRHAGVRGPMDLRGRALVHVDDRRNSRRLHAVRAAHNPGGQVCRRPGQEPPEPRARARIRRLVPRAPRRGVPAGVHVAHGPAGAGHRVRRHRARRAQAHTGLRRLGGRRDLEAAAVDGTLVLGLEREEAGAGGARGEEHPRRDEDG
mmetsp:Transcript_45153/g.127721  ORF Transcript_45153/g.127721 Transcript_45153/m.127721 type:complete len:311 (-) Transcript_45153:725-1657(-)